MAPSFSVKIDLEGDFPEIDDVEGYVERAAYYDRLRVERSYFYRLGNTVSITFVPCADVDCEGIYYIRDIIGMAYATRKTHLEGWLPCNVCRASGRRGYWCRARFSVDIKYRALRQQPGEGQAVQSPEDRYDLF